MQLHPRRKLAIGAAVLAACSFAGGAYAATQESPAGSPQAFLGDVAKRLNVTTQQLTAALEGAIEQRSRQHGFFPLGMLLAPGPGSAPFGAGHHRFGPFGHFRH
jgi:hypothetical protein